MLSIEQLYKIKPIFNINDTNNKQLLIESMHGWSEFKGVICKGKQKTIKLIDFNINCTPEHKLFVNNQWIEAKTLNHIQNTTLQYVYDIINVEDNNCFYIYTSNNKVLVHNCLILDEFAFIAPGCEEAFLNSVFPVVSSSKESQIIIVSTPNGMNNEYYRLWNKAKLNINNR